MRKLTSLMFGSIVAVAAFAAPAHAQATRTWVSGVGDDVNPCSRTAPCKTFPGAISKTAANGEIDCLDPGGFGQVTITKSITIDCGGVTGGILSSLVNGVIVNAGVNDRIVLRNLNIQGVGNGSTGVRFLGGLHLTLENVRIQGTTGIGVDVNKTASGNLYMHNAYITQTGTAVRLFTGAGGINAILNDVKIDAVTGNGLEVASGSTVATIANSAITNVTGSALITSGGGFINADKNIFAKNATGANAQAAGSSIRISNNAFNDNGVAFAVTSGNISSSNTNTVVGTVGPNPGGGAVPFK
ncbi:MAG TPA: right-handed parallel beta-helix repeat-containing protein [Xanthobacteraceae bacterium]|nr:right-handed parallel beta-helix repeat-containing protein [Xanthobacteraceae bacterium]